jgi:hypothetical protein
MGFADNLGFFLETATQQNSILPNANTSFYIVGRSANLAQN